MENISYAKSMAKEDRLEQLRRFREIRDYLEQNRGIGSLQKLADLVIHTDKEDKKHYGLPYNVCTIKTWTDTGRECKKGITPAFIVDLCCAFPEINPNYLRRPFSESDEMLREDAFTSLKKQWEAERERGNENISYMLMYLDRVIRCHIEKIFADNGEWKYRFTKDGGETFDLDMGQTIFLYNQIFAMTKTLFAGTLREMKIHPDLVIKKKDKNGNVIEFEEKQNPWYM